MPLENVPPSFYVPLTSAFEINEHYLINIILIISINRNFLNGYKKINPIFYMGGVHFERPWKMYPLYSVHVSRNLGSLK